MSRPTGRSGTARRKAREVTVIHVESWGRQYALWFPMAGSDEAILEYVERVAHPNREPATDSEARVRHNLDTDYRFLTYGSVVRIGHDTEYTLTRDGWQHSTGHENPIHAENDH